MSADNYYTIKFNRDDLKYYLISGSMSVYEDEWPALISDGDTGFDSWDEAVREFELFGHSEYGLFVEEYPLCDVVTAHQARQWGEERIKTLRHYLGEIS